MGAQPVSPGTCAPDVQAAAPFGLAPLSGRSPTVGVTGYTLGGGTGWLSRKYGFAADSLLAAEVVTADGVTACAEVRIGRIAAHGRKSPNRDFRLFCQAVSGQQ